MYDIKILYSRIYCTSPQVFPIINNLYLPVSIRFSENDLQIPGELTLFGRS